MRIGSPETMDDLDSFVIIHAYRFLHYYPQGATKLENAPCVS